MPKVFTIIPAYNEGETIGQVITDVQKICSNIIVVDDGSGDDTYDRAQALGAKVLRHIVNRGQGAALQTGIEYAFERGADIIVTFDGDGQHVASDIQALTKPIIEGEFEVVLGSRFLKLKVKSEKLKVEVKSKKFIENYMPLSRRIILRLSLMHQWFFSGLKVSDNHCGLRAFSRHAAQKIKITQDRMSHASEILDQIARYKLKFVEVPVNVKYTNYSLQKGQKTLKGSLRIVYDFLMGRVVNV